MIFDVSMPITLGALIQAVTPLIAAIAFLIALRSQWRGLIEQREHDRETNNVRMGAIEAAMKATTEELRLMREALVVVANQSVRLDYLEKGVDELKRGIGFIRPATT